MACATLAVKRHRHFDFEPFERNHKRRRISGSRTTMLSSAVPPTRKQEEEKSSPFANLSSLLSWDQDELMSRIRYHVKRYNRQKLLAEQQQQNAQSASNNIQNAQLSPHIIHPTTQMQQNLLLSNQLPNIQTNQIEGPRFTLKQASILCERAMKEKEEKLKLEYEQILSSRLAEQYECFLKFNNDTMYRGPKEQASSYVS